jgi:hypothetical protein
MTVADALRGRRLHLGCGDERLDGYVNADIRATSAADIVLDLTELELPRGAVELVYSNAFFEHLARTARAAHLAAVRSALAPAGAACYLGMPYFPNVARFYLAGAPGTAGERFDLYNAYRYTHGDPDGKPDWYFEQLHKSLFDEDELDLLLTEAGFGAHAVFAYGYPGDQAELPVTCGFYAVADAIAGDEVERRAEAFLAEHDGRRVRLSTLQRLLVRSPLDEPPMRRPMPDAPPFVANRWHGRALHAAEQGELEEAAALLRTAVTDSLDVTVLNDLAVILARGGDRAGARALLEACLVVEPDRADAAENLAALGDC